MATLPTTKRISKEDIKDAPSWFSPFLDQVNTFFSAVYDALNGQLTFVENFSSLIKDLTFTTLTTYSSGYWNQLSFTNTLRKKVSGIFILNMTIVSDNFTPLTSAPFVSWQELGGSVIIEFITGLDDETTYNLKLLVV